MTVAPPDDSSPATETGLIDFVFGEVWSRPGLSRRDRRFVTLPCVAAADAEGPLRDHVYAALNSGDLSIVEMRETVLHFAVYSGWPKASRFNMIVDELWDRIHRERGQAVPPPEPLLPLVTPSNPEERLRTGEQSFKDINCLPFAPQRDNPYQGAGILNFVFGEMWLRPGLGMKERRLWRGRETETLRAIGTITGDRTLNGEGKALTAPQWALAVLYNGLGRYEEACDAAAKGCEYPQELGLALSSLVELVEAATRSGKRDLAAEAADRLTTICQASGTAWATGTSAAARALISEGSTADALYREAIARLESTSVRTALARTRLLYGEWLRRENRRAEARDQLARAHEILDRAGAEAFAERARRELEAAGETVRRRTTGTDEALTPQEAQIARLAGEGLTNLEIGAQLFLSPHTIEWHLRKVFTKLGIRSRKQLGAVLPGGAATPA
jgi:DNA-binding CsgD family transcriptional regulator/alkylhydroperoxidase/carboxymuconolactone decarboxylase family protein YurZ